MATKVTANGRVTLPKKVREAAGIKPGDRVDVRVNASGGVIVEKLRRVNAYKRKLLALGQSRMLDDNMTTDEFMVMLRGDPALDPGLASPSSKSKAR
ncbi:MAG: AbrB/MazE/SpoVT family DNA-binding domain-containing protein [Beijerinckiaceae bacterium]|nr:AbrB/MazE/SpoVT family DNA-binding domain-containing protein [Beijerinckiaceae bacterium]